MTRGAAVPILALFVACGGTLLEPPVDAGSEVSDAAVADPDGSVPPASNVRDAAVLVERDGGAGALEASVAPACACDACSLPASECIDGYHLRWYSVECGDGGQYVLTAHVHDCTEESAWCYGGACQEPPNTK